MAPSEFWLGIEQFNRRQFYACHDTLEALWMEATEPDKTFYQGILQIAVALYHLGNQNLRGAAILLGEGTNRLRHYRPDYEEVDVESLVQVSLALLSKIQQSPPDRAADLAQLVLTPSEADDPPIPTIQTLSET